MKRALIFAIVIFVAFFAGGKFLLNNSNEQLPAVPATKSTTQSIKGTTTAPRDLPKKLRIEKLKIDASLEHVGMDDKGNMDVPKEPMNAAWYQLGFAPGEKGSAVIAGHFDDPNGDPAVFYSLDKLRSGDEIDVELQSGKTLTYIVEKTARHPFDSFPLQEVFNTTDKPRLNLITCDGVFDKSQSTYLHRFVVYASTPR